MHHLSLAAGAGAGSNDGSSSAPAWVALTVAAVALVGVMITAVLAYLGNRRTSKVADGANRIAKEAQAETTSSRRREEWWKRAQWGMERACDSAAGTAGQRVGIAVLNALSLSLLAQQEERDMIKSVMLIVMGVTP